MNTARKPVILISLIVLFIAFSFYSTSSAQDEDELEGDPFVGGRLYAAWDAILRVELPQENHPLWYEAEPIDLNSWRCVTCHGWDYNGREISPASETEEGVKYPGVFTMVAEPEENVIAWLDGSNNPDHDFSAYISDHHMQDLSAFLITGLVNSDLYVEKETGRVRGAALTGEVLYKLKCRECHGSDGARINFGTAKRPAFLGNLANVNPWRAAHIVRFGHVYTIVHPRANFGWSFYDEIDLLAYLQLLPLAEHMKEDEDVVEEVIDYSQQGDVRSLIFAAAGIVVVIIFGNLWAARWNRK
jgi:mono/diheme cytochrome c family protein